MRSLSTEAGAFCSSAVRKARWSLVCHGCLRTLLPVVGLCVVGIFKLVCACVRGSCSTVVLGVA